MRWGDDRLPRLRSLRRLRRGGGAEPRPAAGGRDAGPPAGQVARRRDHHHRAARRERRPVERRRPPWTGCASRRGCRSGNGPVTFSKDGGRPVAAVVLDRAPSALPAPDPGDIFFDFEGDPLWEENGSGDWGLEYLFGVVEARQRSRRSGRSGRTTAGRSGRRSRSSSTYVAARRAAHPRMHIYHYAPYERTALLRLAGRHGVGEQAIDDLLRERRARGPVRDCAPGPAGVAAVILAQEARAALHGRRPAHRGRQRGRLDRRVRRSTAQLRGAATTMGTRQRSRRHRRLQRVRLPLHAAVRDWLLGRAAERGVAPGREAAPPGPLGWNRRRRRRTAPATGKPAAGLRCSWAAAAAGRTQTLSEDQRRSPWSRRPSATTGAKTNSFGGGTSTG